MAEGPLIPKRIDASAPPTDLPDTQLSYPGKPLSHRYIPTEKSRKVEEPRDTGGARLASDTPFTPIASVNYGDRNIHLGPISNVRSRTISPVATSGSVDLPGSGEDNFEISDDIRGPLAARLERLSTPTQPVLNLAEPTAEASPTIPNLGAETPGAHNQNFITEIEKLKEVAATQLAERESKKTKEPSPEGLLATPRESPPVTEIRTSEKPVGFLDQKETTDYTGGSQRLLQQAEQLEKELNKLREGIVQKEEERKENTAAETTKLETYEAQIAQLVSDRTALASKVNELTAAHSEELAKRKGLEQDLQKVSEDYERRLKETEQEKDQVISSQNEQLTKTNHLETEVQQLESEFKSRLQDIEAEKTGLLDKINALEKESSSEEEQREIEKEADELNKLQALAAGLTKERDAYREQSTKLEEQVNTLRKDKESGHKEQILNRPLQEEPREREAPPEKPVRSDQESRVKVVKPLPAVGKMAPSLTTAPNVINGIVKDPTGMLLPNVIIVVKDAENQPVRALKTNKIGQFAISTPLANGTYIMELESEGHSFDIIQVEVEGKVMPPIELRANK